MMEFKGALEELNLKHIDNKMKIKDDQMLFKNEFSIWK